MVACPRCGSQDAVQKVRSIVSSGTYETTYEMPAQGQIGEHKFYGTVQQRGMAQTALAQRLNIDRTDKAWKTFTDEHVKAATKAFGKENPAPRAGSRAEILAVLALLVLLAGFVGLFAGNVMSGTSCAGVVPLGLSLLLAWGISNLGVKLTSPERKEWEADLAATKANAVEEAAQIKKKTLARWERLYYCHRDDLVFLPEEHLSAPSSDMMRMLMWE